MCGSTAGAPRKKAATANGSGCSLRRPSGISGEAAAGQQRKPRRATSGVFVCPPRPARLRCRCFRDGLVRTKFLPNSDRSKMGMAMSDTATLSSKFQISIPMAVRTARRWKAGQEFAFIPKGTGVLLVPVPEPAELAGIAKGGKGKDLPRSQRPGLMRLVDTSAWIEWLISSPTGNAVQSAIPARNDWLVPTIVQLELAKWSAREVGEDKADQIIAFTQMCRVIPLDTKVALAASEFCSKYKLGDCRCSCLRHRSGARCRSSDLRRSLQWPARRHFRCKNQRLRRGERAALGVTGARSSAR
jgi:bifunctional DNA-binding transcriptional regulator/antitoxin component of YhaV-PrlF toxin-antitoxin module